MVDMAFSHDLLDHPGSMLSNSSCCLSEQILMVLHLKFFSKSISTLPNLATLERLAILNFEFPYLQFSNLLFKIRLNHLAYSQKKTKQINLKFSHSQLSNIAW